MPHSRIVQDPNIMMGKPTIRGIRVTASMIMRQLAQGETVASLLERYPYLTREDISEVLKYAAWRLEEREVSLA